MDTEQDPTEREGARDEDNPEPSEDVGQEGLGTDSGAIGGLEEGTEPKDEDARRHEQP